MVGASASIDIAPEWVSEVAELLAAAFATDRSSSYPPSPITPERYDKLRARFHLFGELRHDPHRPILA